MYMKKQIFLKEYTMSKSQMKKGGENSEE